VRGRLLSDGLVMMEEAELCSGLFVAQATLATRIRHSMVRFIWMAHEITDSHQIEI
jgi:hypothetical protein